MTDRGPVGEEDELTAAIRRGDEGTVFFPHHVEPDLEGFALIEVFEIPAGPGEGLRAGSDFQPLEINRSFLKPLGIGLGPVFPDDAYQARRGEKTRGVGGVDAAPPDDPVAGTARSLN